MAEPGELEEQGRAGVTEDSGGTRRWGVTAVKLEDWGELSEQEQLWEQIRVADVEDPGGGGRARDLDGTGESFVLDGTSGREPRKWMESS